MRRFFLISTLVLLTAAGAKAQVAIPNPPVSGTITAATTNASCAPIVQGNGAVDQQLNSINGAVGVSITGTWVATINVQGSVDHGKTWTALTTPFTANQQAIYTTTGYSDICVFASPFTSGTVAVQFATSSATPSSGGSGASSTQVQGAAAADAAAVGNPVLVGGVDAAGNVQELPVADAGTVAPTQTLITGGVDSGGNTRQLATNTAGNLAWVTNPDADGQSNTAGFTANNANGSGSALVVYPHLFNGTIWDRSFYCPTTKFVTGVTATTTQIVAAVAAQKIRICSVTIERNDVTGVATTLKLVEGTGANCATGQTSLTGNLFSSGTTAVTTDSPPVAITLGADSAFITNTAADALCVQTTGAASSFDVTITEAQY